MTGKSDTWRIGTLLPPEVMRAEMPAPDGAKMTIRLRAFTIADLQRHINLEREYRARLILTAAGKTTAPFSDDYIAEIKRITDTEAGAMIHNVGIAESDTMRVMIAFIHQVVADDLAMLQRAFGKPDMSPVEFAAVLCDSYGAQAASVISGAMAKLEMASGNEVVEQVLNDFDTQKKNKIQGLIVRATLIGVLCFACGYWAAQAAILTRLFAAFAG